MALLLRATLLYLLAGGLFVAIFRDNPADLLRGIFSKLPGSMALFVHLAWWVLPFFALLFLLISWRDLLARLPRAVLAVFLCMLFFLTFTMLKNSLPFAVGFWADPLMARIDRLLHLGSDPWRLAHRAEGWLNLRLASLVYFRAWLVPAMFAPVLLILFDGDEARQRRFLLIWFFAWIGLGNVLALAFMSAGPVYYDRLLGSETFSGLTEALKRIGIADSGVGALQERLWQAYRSGAREAGSGISAFPSVHIGIATMFALYLYERARWLMPLSVALVAVYIFLSVFLGWHYAVDGYFSALAVLFLWLWLRKRDLTRGSD